MSINEQADIDSIPRHALGQEMHLTQSIAHINVLCQPLIVVNLIFDVPLKY